jgi:hypothetical protein
VLLQLIGTGIGLAALDFADAQRLRHVGIGTSVWTLVAPIVAMFVGGLVAGVLSHTRRARGGALHGFVMWALTSIGGGLAVLWIVAALAGTHADNAVYGDATVRVQEAGRALLCAGASLLLSLGAALAGAGIGARERHHRHDTAPMAVVAPPPDAPVVP